MNLSVEQQKSALGLHVVGWRALGLTQKYMAQTKISLT